MVPRCSFCDRSRDEVGKLITSRVPKICDGCVELAKAYVDERHKGGELKLMREPCEFCRDLMARCQFTAYGHVICDVCVELCVGILAEDR